MGHFLGLTPVLGCFGLVSLQSISTLNFGPLSMKLGGTVRAIKKWPTMTTDLVPAGITEKRSFLRFADFFCVAKNPFFQKKTPSLEFTETVLCTYEQSKYQRWQWWFKWWLLRLWGSQKKICLGQSPQMDVQRNKELCLQVANLEITRHQSANATTKDGTECIC